MQGQRPPLLDLAHDPPGIVSRRSLSRRSSSRRHKSPRSPRLSPKNSGRSPKTKAERSITSDDDEEYDFPRHPSQTFGFPSAMNVHESRQSLSQADSWSSGEESVEEAVLSPGDARNQPHLARNRSAGGSDMDSSAAARSSVVTLEPVPEDSSSPPNRTSIPTPPTSSTGDIYSAREPALIEAPQPERRAPIKLGSFEGRSAGGSSRQLGQSSSSRDDVLFAAAAAASSSSRYDRDSATLSSEHVLSPPSRRRSEVVSTHAPPVEPKRRSSLTAAPLSIEVPRREPSYIRESGAPVTESMPYPQEVPTPSVEFTDAEADYNNPQPYRRRSLTFDESKKRRQSQKLSQPPTQDDIAADYLPNPRRRASLRGSQDGNTPQGEFVYLSDDATPSGTAYRFHQRYESGRARTSTTSQSAQDTPDNYQHGRHMSSDMEMAQPQTRRRSMTATTDDTKEYPAEGTTPYREATDVESDYLPRPHRRMSVKKEAARRQSLKGTPAPAPAPAPHPPGYAESDAESRRAGSLYEAEPRSPKTDEEMGGGRRAPSTRMVAAIHTRVISASERPGSVGSPRRASEKVPLSDGEDGARSSKRGSHQYTAYASTHPQPSGRPMSTGAPPRWADTSDRGYDSYTEGRRGSRTRTPGGAGGGRRRASSAEKPEASKPMFVFKDVRAHDSSGKTLLDGVTGFMHEGEIMAVMGLSGGGKTTFLRGLTTPKTDSHVSYTSQMLARPGMRVGFVGDEYLLLDHLTVQETVKYSILLDSPSLDEARLQKRLNRWIRQMDLGEAANRQIKFLSAGQRKRVQVLQLLVKSCNMMILDEPLTALDSLTALNLMKELRRLANEERISIILSLHQPRSQIFECLDFVLVVHHGRMAYFGPAFNALDRVMGFLQSANRESFKQLPKLDALEKEGGNEFEAILANADPTSEQAHLLLDLLAASSSLRAKSKRNKAFDVCDMFMRSESYKILQKTVAEIMENPNSELEPYAVGDIAIAKGGFVWKRSWLASARFMTDMTRDVNAWIVNVATAVVLTVAIGFMWFGLGGDPSLDFPTAQGAFFYTLAAGVFALVQLPVPRYCLLYNMYRQEAVDGTHTAEQLLIEAVLCTTAFPLFYAVVSIIPYFLTFSTLAMNWTVLVTNLLLAITAQMMGWFFVFAFNGNVVLSLSSFMAAETILLACDGFVVPPASIRGPWIFAYWSNVRTWYLKANMIDLLCGDLCGSTSSGLQSSLGSLQEQLAYEWPSGGEAETRIDTVVYSYLKAFFDLTGYSVNESITYCIYITLAYAVLAVITLYGARWIYSDKLRLQGQGRVGQERWARVRSIFNVDLLVHTFSVGSVVAVLVLSAVFGTTGAKSISETYTGPKSIGYSSAVQGPCPECMGIPNANALYSDLLSLADYHLFMARFDVSFRTLLDSTKGADQLCENNNYFHPTSTQLTISSVDDVFADYMPRAIAGMVEDPDRLVSLEHAEGRLARIWTEVVSADVLQRVSTYPVPDFAGPAGTTVDTYIQATYGQTLQTAVQEGRIYQFVRVDGIGDQFKIDDTHQVRNPYVLFYRNSSDEDLHTVAIKLSNIAAVLVPPTTPTTYDWPMAKALVRNAITLKAMLRHFIHIHHLGTAVGIAVEESFSKSHPLYQVLFSFRDRLRFFATLDDALGIGFPLVGLTLEKQIDLLSKTEGEFNFAEDLDYESLLSARGLDDSTDGLYLPFRPLTQQYWAAANNYSAEVVDFVYATDAAVQNDKSLQKWVKAMRDSDAGNIPGLTQSSCGICDRPSLKQLLGRLFFCSLSHTSTFVASRVGELMFYPFSAPSLRVKDTELPTGSTITEAQYLAMFSDSEAILEALHFFHKGSTMVQLPLRDWSTAVKDENLRLITQHYVDNVYSVAEQHEAMLGEPLVSRLEGTVVL